MIYTILVNSKEYAESQMVSLIPNLIIQAKIMSYFTKDFSLFFKELEANNDREWFAENKKRYETSVKAPFIRFIQELINEISDLEGPLPMEAKDAIFRINRDIRFSKDKSPYKIHASALISKGGKKSMKYPGIYFQANHVDVRVYSGIYQMEKEDLTRVRHYIADHPNELIELIENKEFKSIFGEIHGDKNKRLPVEFMEVAELVPLIYNKNFYFFKKLPANRITGNDLMGEVLEIYRKSEPIRTYLSEGLNYK